MKKIINLFSVLALVAGSLLFSGCGAMTEVTFNPTAKIALEQAFIENAVDKDNTSHTSYLESIQEINDVALEAQSAYFDLSHYEVEVEAKALEAYIEADGNEALLEGYLRPIKEGFLANAWEKVKSFLEKAVNLISKAVNTVWDFVVKIFNRVREKVREWLKKNKDKKESSEDKKDENKEGTKTPAPGIPASSPAPKAKEEAPVSAKTNKPVESKPAAISTPKPAESKPAEPVASPAASTSTALMIVPEEVKDLKIYPLYDLFVLTRSVSAFVNATFCDLQSYMVQKGFFDKKIKFSPDHLPKIMTTIKDLVGWDDHNGTLKLNGDPAEKIMSQYEDKKVLVTKSSLNAWLTYADKIGPEISKDKHAIGQKLMDLHKYIKYGTKDVAGERSRINIDAGGEEVGGEANKEMQENMKFNTNYFNSVIKVISAFTRSVVKIWNDEVLKVQKYTTVVK